MSEAESKLQELKIEADRQAKEQTELPLDGYRATSGDRAASHPDVQDLKEAHEDFYDAYQNVVKRHIPKCKLRDKIWDLGRLFLKEGNPNEGDCRQACRTQRKGVRKEVIEWVMEDDGRAPTDLFNRFFQLNRSAGYHPERVL